MVIQPQIEITQQKDDALEVTLRGTPTEVVNILAKGLPREALMQLHDALTAELKAHGLTE